MKVSFVTTEGAQVMGLDTDYIFPAKGDVVVAPDGSAYVVMQRNFLTQEVHVPGKVVDLSAPRAVDIYLQIVLQAVKVKGASDAIKS